MWTRLRRFRRAREAAFRLRQERWEVEVDGEELSSRVIQRFAPTVLEPLDPDTALQRQVRELLVAGRLDEARILLERESSATTYVLALSGLGVLLSLLPPLLIVLTVSGSTPTTISNPGHHCSVELERGLIANREARDFHYDVAPEDVATLMEAGRVTLRYFRDGVPVEVSYRVRVQEQECRLEAWQVRRDLGQRWEGARGDFGSVVLRECHCQ